MSKGNRTAGSGAGLRVKGNGCVAAELVLGERLVHALAPERLLTVQEQVRVDALARAAAERLAALPHAV